MNAVPTTVGVVGGGRMGAGIAQLLRDKVGRGELGKKSGQGFYNWEGTR
ncbi:MAG TPA: hypothetical protein VGQ92_26760 [Actinoplanes sp.]|jgi:3-hydroxyacyl-CoA dehydrogenase|nr:hypothetical protein [Actinoplanes sp.]